MRKLYQLWIPIFLVCLLATAANAQSFKLQCPAATPFHPLTGGANAGEIKCQQISGGDGFATMADGTQTYLFSFGPLSGLQDIANGLPGTQSRAVFMTPYDPNNSATANGAVSPCSRLWVRFALNGLITAAAHAIADKVRATANST